MARIRQSLGLFSSTLFLSVGLVCTLPSLSYSQAEELRDQVSFVLSQRANQDPVQRTALRDKLSFEWIKKNIHDRPEVPTVFFAVGNYSQKTRADWPAGQYENVLAGVRNFLDQGYRIAYDKDSPVLTELIHANVKPRMRLGISGEIPVSPKPGEERFSTTRTIVIQNPWFHLKALLNFRSAVVTPDSYLGTALVIKAVPLKNGPRLYTFNDSVGLLGRIGDWANDLENGHSTDRNPQTAEPVRSEPPSAPVVSWFSSLFGFTSTSPTASTEIPSEERKIVNLRIKYPANHLPVSLNSAFPKVQGEEVSEELKGVSAVFPPFHLETFAEDSDDEMLRDAFTFSEEYVAHFNETNQGLGKGAAVFGSGDDHPLYRDLLESTVRVLVQDAGLPIATGGMGGYMAVANRVAKELGAESIGIPGIKKKDAPLEIEIFHQYHTRTIPVKDYEERIPFLLSRGGEYVVYAPGGPGTMQELATHLVQIAARKGKTAPLVFLDRDYYAGLVTWLSELPFSEGFRHKILLIHQAEELRLKIQAKKLLFPHHSLMWMNYI